MARSKLSPAERDKRKKERAAERRRLRKQGNSSTPKARATAKNNPTPNTSTNWEERVAADGKDLRWLDAARVRPAAHRVINQSRARPYYVSIYWPKGSGLEPSFGFYPCGYFFSDNGRVYYSFSLPEHRDAVFEAHKDTSLRARKETRTSVAKAHKNPRS